MLEKSKTLKENGIENESEVSWFRLSDYLQYKENPVIKW